MFGDDYRIHRKYHRASGPKSNIYVSSAAACLRLSFSLWSFLKNGLLSAFFPAFLKVLFIDFLCSI